MNKPGRNDLCFCGSGEKYKNCHMKQDQEREAARRGCLEAARFLRKDLLSFARDTRFAVGFAKALPLYWNNLYELENAEAMSQNEALRFFDWFVFDAQQEDGSYVIQTYHAERRADLSQYQQEVLDKWVNATPAGAYELLAYEGQLLKVRDYLTGEEFELYEPGGRGVVEEGELLLTRLVWVYDQWESSTTAAYLPAAEITNLAEKMTAVKAAYLEEHPHASHIDFMRARNYLIIHHALEQAEVQGRPPVARLDANRPDKLVQKAAQAIKRRFR